MAIKHLPDGVDFHEHPDSFPESFGFQPMSGSNKKVEHTSTSHKKMAEGAGGKNVDNVSNEGAPMDDMSMATMAEGGSITHHPDGRVTHHHAHGGRTVVHPNGMVDRHHAEGGMTRHHVDGHAEHHDSSEYLYRAHGGGTGDEMQDREMVTKGVHQHESHLHHGEPETEMHLAKGGAIGRRASFPKGMKPHIEGMHTPVNTAPRNPKFSRSATNVMPGGVEPYGVQPSTEPDPAGSDQGIPQLRRGGRMMGRE